MVQINFLVSAAHHFDHLLPVYRALPPGARGRFYLRMVDLPPAPTDDDRLDALRTFDALQQHVRAADVPSELPSAQSLSRLGRETALVVAAVSDGAATPEAVRLIFMDAGVGQMFEGEGLREPHCAGGPGRERASLVLCPSERCLEASRLSYPDIPAVVVGCPKVDAFARMKPKPRSRPPVIAISFHYDNRAAGPEACGVLPHYESALATLAASPFTVLGHGHPQPAHWWHLAALYRDAGIEVVPDFAEVVRRADLYIVDQGSTLFEFAALDRPVIVLNAPWYRRDVQHGLRFWEYADVGFQVGDPDALLETIPKALADPPGQRQRRREIVRAVFPFFGRAARVAADAILSHLTQGRQLHPLRATLHDAPRSTRRARSS